MKRYKQYKKLECLITSGTRFVLEFLIENVIVGTEWKQLTVARVWVRGQAVRRCPPSFALGSLDCHSWHVVGVGGGAAAAAFPRPADGAAAYCQTDRSCRSLSGRLAFWHGWPWGGSASRPRPASWWPAARSPARWPSVRHHDAAYCAQEDQAQGAPYPSRKSHWWSGGSIYAQFVCWTVPRRSRGACDRTRAPIVSVLPVSGGIDGSGYNDRGFDDDCCGT